MAAAVAGCNTDAVTDGGQSLDAGSGCVSDGGYVVTGLLEPSGCRRCAPTASGGWTPVPDGTPCVLPSEGAICLGGSCEQGCFIDGGFIAPGSVNPASSCQICAVASTSQWTAVTRGSACADGGVCDSSGVCGPRTSCTLGSVEIPNRASNPADPSLCCNVSRDPYGWSPRLVNSQSFTMFGVTPGSLVAGHFKDDGWLDLAQQQPAFGNTTQIQMLLNFQGILSGGLFNGTQTRTFSMVGVDLDRDGLSDLVAADLSSLSVLMCLGGGGFTYPPSVYPSDDPLASVSNGGCATLTSGDFNGDGVPDVLCRATSTILLFQGIGDGGLAPFVSIANGSGSGAASADFNSDGISDVAFGLGDAGGFAVLLGSGSGAFLDGGSSYAPTGTGSRLGQMSAADFNGDGAQDLAVEIQIPSPPSYRLGIVFGLGDGTFGGWQTLPLPGPVDGLTHADLDGDGSEELLVSSQTSDGVKNVPVLYQLTFADGGGLQELMRADAGSFVPISGDFNNDLAADIAGTTYKASTEDTGTVVYFNGCP